MKALEEMRLCREQTGRTSIVMLAVAMLMVLLGAVSYQMRRSAVVDRSTDVRESLQEATRYDRSSAV